MGTLKRDGRLQCAPHTPVAQPSASLGQALTIDFVPGTGLLDPRCIQYLWEALRSSADIAIVRRQGSMETTAVLELPPLATDIDHEMVAVAAKELTAESLGLHDPNITLNDIQQRLLQEVAQVCASFAVFLAACLHACVCAHLGSS